MSLPIFDPMEYIWDKLPKMPDGRVLYFVTDPPYLYENGFVDTTSFTLPEWEAAFQPFKQKDGNYILSKDDFFSLRRYRDNNVAKTPFDANTLREGPWPDSELDTLYELTIKPSSSLSHSIYWTAINALKRQGHVDANQQLNIDDKVKKQIAYLIERFPSPRRRLEKEVARIKQEEKDKERATQKNRNASDFVVGKTKSEQTADAFKNLEGRPQNQIINPDSKNNVDLKTLRKPNPKFMG